MQNPWNRKVGRYAERVITSKTDLDLPVAGSVLMLILSISPKVWKCTDISSCLASWKEKISVFSPGLMSRWIHFACGEVGEHHQARCQQVSQTCGSPPTNSLRSSSSAKISDVSMDSAIVSTIFLSARKSVSWTSLCPRTWCGNPRFLHVERWNTKIEREMFD